MFGCEQPSMWRLALTLSDKLTPKPSFGAPWETVHVRGLLWRVLRVYSHPWAGAGMLYKVLRAHAGVGR